MKLSVRTKKWVAVLAALVAILILTYVYQCGFQKVCKSPILEHVVRGDKTLILPQGTVTVEVADTASAREQGLSGRTSLPGDKGMLFVFDQPGRYGFWMKDMLFSIDMVWINADGVVVHVEDNISPDTYFKQNPPQTFINQPNAKYVLELAAGQAEKYGLYLGTKVSFK